MKYYPKFNKRMPSDARSYFDPNYDEKFKKANPTTYALIVTLGITALMLPNVLFFIILSNNINLSDSNLWPLLGMFGAFIIGIGLFNIVAAFLQQYLGHIVTLICLSSGLLLCMISFILSA